jgi:hypothetical protein
VTPRPTAICAQVVSTSRAASGTTCGHIGVSTACAAAAASARSSGTAMAAPLVAAADADTGAQALRTRAVVRLLPHNALRVDEACSAGLADLSEDRGHRALTVLGEGTGRRRSR